MRQNIMLTNQQLKEYGIYIAEVQNSVHLLSFSSFKYLHFFI